jgi:hypothetical protein
LGLGKGFELFFGPRIVRMKLEDFAEIVFGFLKVTGGPVGLREHVIGPHRGGMIGGEVHFHNGHRFFCFVLCQQGFRELIQRLFAEIIFA